jgi:threonine/homoserine/homoserine lactone efflux protein
MEPFLFLKGLIVAFVMAIPIGPVGVLCVRKTLAEGHSRGLIIGLGAATADLVNGSIAAFGLTFISDAIASQQLWLRLAGGGLLLFLGTRLLRARRRDTDIAMDNKGLLGSYVSAFLIALTNPVTVFAFIAVFASLGLGQGLTIFSACFLALGVFAGSWLWFLVLGYLSALFRTRLDTGGLRSVDRIAGGLIIVSGVAAFISVL